MSMIKEELSPNLSAFSLILPAKNEATGLHKLLPFITQHFPNAEVIVVNDGSTDDTEMVCIQNSVKMLTHPYSMGNGASIKTGARYAKNDIVIFYS